MTHALNMTLPLKQDAETQARLAQLEAVFADQIQGKIGEALKKSRIVHFARVVVIENKYIQVLTEYEGDHQEYTEFFRRELTPIFAAIFALADGVPDVRDPAKFWEYSKSKNIRSLGMSVSGSVDMEGKPAGWLFSAYDGRTVEQVLDVLEAAGG